LGKVAHDTVIKACQLFYGKNRKAFVERAKGNERRQLAIYLAIILNDGKGKEIGRYFGIKRPAVSDTMKRVERKLDKDSQLRDGIGFLKGKILSEFLRFALSRPYQPYPLKSTISCYRQLPLKLPKEVESWLIIPQRTLLPHPLGGIKSSETSMTPG
jgi:hypothetical protein